MNEELLLAAIAQKVGASNWRIKVRFFWTSRGYSLELQPKLLRRVAGAGIRAAGEAIERRA